jgi:WD40-like Beta Propeller Repeat
MHEHEFVAGRWRRLGATVALAAGCGSSPSSSDGVSAVIGVEGGTIKHPSGARLEIPRTAISQGSYKLTVSGPVRLPEIEESDYGNLTTGTRFEPHGLRFDIPALAAIPVRPEHNVVLRFDDGSDLEPEVVALASLEGTSASLLIDGFSIYAGATLRCPSQRRDIDFEACVYKGHYEEGVRESSTTRFLCEGSRSLHDAYGPCLGGPDLEAFAGALGGGFASIYEIETDPAYGVVYAWVDNIYVGMLPRDSQWVGCEDTCGRCPDRLSLLLTPGPHALRLEAYPDRWCTAYSNRGPIACGQSFDPGTSLLASLSTHFNVTQGACSDYGFSLVGSGSSSSTGGSDGGTGDGGTGDGGTGDGGTGDGGTVSPTISGAIRTVGGEPGRFVLGGPDHYLGMSIEGDCAVVFAPPPSAELMPPGYETVVDRHLVYVVDFQTDQVEAVSVDDSGRWPQDTFISNENVKAVVTSDCRRVVFASSGDFANEGDLEGRLIAGTGARVYMRDREAGSTVRVSPLHRLDGLTATSLSNSREPTISPDGTTLFVVNRDEAHNGPSSAELYRIMIGAPDDAEWVPLGDQPFVENPFFLDGGENLVVVRNDGATAGREFALVGQDGSARTIYERPDYLDAAFVDASADGSIVLRNSVTPVQGRSVIEIEDLASGMITRLGLDTPGWQGSAYSGEISGDGRYVVFVSDDAQLNASYNQVLRYDRLEDRVDWLSLGMDGQPANHDCWQPRINHDGSRVLFYGQYSDSSNLVVSPSTMSTGLFLWEAGL